MLPIIWLPAARADLLEIIRYVANDNPQTARRLKAHIEASILPTSEHPYLYRKSERIPGLREIVAHPNYLIFYRVTAHHIEIVNVVHARREFP
jgi:toxin ParE1/3/4